MTKENREKAYKHFRNMEKNYEARDGLNSGPTATSTVRKRAKETADAILTKHPEIEKPIMAEENKPEEEEKPEEEDKKKTKSKGRK